MKTLSMAASLASLLFAISGCGPSGIAPAASSAFVSATTSRGVPAGRHHGGISRLDSGGGMTGDDSGGGMTGDFHWGHVRLGEI
jgi:hypothetical protein